MTGEQILEPCASTERLDVRLSRGAVEIDEVVEIARLLAVYLDAEHARGVIDGALVPARIEVRIGGSPRLLPADEAALAIRAYTAPEAWDAPPAPASDQFAMAAILYEALCGGRAFPGDDSQKIRVSVTTGSRVPLAARVPGLAYAVDGVFERALHPSPELRFDSCSEFADALVAAIERSRDEAEKVLVQKPSTRPSARPPVEVLDEPWDDDPEPAPIPWLKVAVGMVLLAIVAAALAVLSGK